MNKKTNEENNKELLKFTNQEFLEGIETALNEGHKTLKKEIKCLKKMVKLVASHKDLKETKEGIEGELKKLNETLEKNKRHTLIVEELKKVNETKEGQKTIESMFLLLTNR